MSDEHPDEGGDVLGLLGDDHVQAILVATSREAKSARELSEEIDADISTIYRHVEDMVEYDLLAEQTRIVEDGSHHSVYEANIEHIGIDVEEGELNISLKMRESPAERFTRIWDDIRET